MVSAQTRARGFSVSLSTCLKQLRRNGVTASAEKALTNLLPALQLLVKLQLKHLSLKDLEHYLNNEIPRKVATLWSYLFRTVIPLRVGATSTGTGPASGFCEVAERVLAEALIVIVGFQSHILEPGPLSAALFSQTTLCWEDDMPGQYILMWPEGQTRWLIPTI